jgi:aminoglycoside phosphotransferase (APT) family kinase protein
MRAARAGAASVDRAVLTPCDLSGEAGVGGGGTNQDRLSAVSAERSLRLACEATGLSLDGAVLVRLGENAIYVLPSEGVAVRIARSAANLPKVEKELRVARWLADVGFPAVRVAEEITEQPLRVDGRVVSFWRAVAPWDATATIGDLALLLRRFHALPSPPIDLPAFDPFAAVPHRLRHAVVGSDDLRFLDSLHERLRKEYQRLEFSAPLGLIHGDAHRANTLVSDGTPILLDFEVVAIGPREWDLVPTALAVGRFELDEETYGSFVAAYGRDITKWTGYPVLRAIRELTMTTWLMQNVEEDPSVAAEFALRVASLREGDLGRVWHAF